METKTRYLSFSIQGEFITTTGRDKLFKNHDLQGALNFIKGCLQSDQLTDKETEQMAYDILNGRAEIVGTYPGDDYCFRYIEGCENKSDIADAIQTWTDKLDENENAKNKLLFIEAYLKEDYPSVLHYLERDYEDSYDEELFEKPEKEPPEYSYANSLLQSYMDRMQTDTEDDYGWLEPDGTFHPVEWGEHENWANKYVQEKLNITEWFQANIPTNGIPKSSGDYLYDQGWGLLHNPAQGIAIYTHNPSKRITKSQAEFLYDYYVKRNQHQKADEIWKEFE